MRQVTVILFGQDNERHEMRVDATSLFDAVEQATRQVSRLWWYDPRRIVEVRSGAEKWRVDPEKLRNRRGNSCRYEGHCLNDSRCDVRRPPLIPCRGANGSGLGGS